MERVINPQTGRQIKVDGLTYKRLVKEGIINQYNQDLEKLPTDLLLLIFDQMKKQDIINLCSTNAKLYKRCQSERIQQYIDNIPDYQLEFNVLINPDDNSFSLFSKEDDFIMSEKKCQIIMRKDNNKYYTLYLPFGKTPKISTLEIINIKFNDKNIKELKFAYSGSGTIDLRIPKNVKYNEIYCIPNRDCFREEDLEEYFDLEYKPFGNKTPSYKMKEIDNILYSWKFGMDVKVKRGNLVTKFTYHSNTGKFGGIHKFE